MRRATPACQSADTPDGHLAVTVGHSVSARAARETQHASATLTLARQNANGAARRQSARHHAHRITRAGRRANTHAHSQCGEVDAHGDSKINVAAQDKKKRPEGKNIATGENPSYFLSQPVQTLLGPGGVPVTGGNTEKQITCTYSLMCMYLDCVCVWGGRDC